MLGIVILNFNTKKLTEAATKNVLNISSDIRIVIVDNNSSDDSWEYLSKKFIDNPQITLVQNKENLGYAKGNNIGILELIKNTEIKYVGIMNPDVKILTKMSLDNCLKILEKFDNIASINPTMVLNDMISLDFLSWKIPKKYDDIFLSFSILKRIYNPVKYKNFLLKKYDDIFFVEGEVLPGSFFIMKKEVFQKINFFDENTFLYCEERILGAKLKKINMKQAILVNDFYKHDHQHKEKSFKSEIFHMKELNKSRIYYNNKYNGKIGVLVAVLLKYFFFMMYLERVTIKICRKWF